MGNAFQNTARRVIIAAVTTLALIAPVRAQGTFPLRFLPTGGMAKAGGSLIQVLTLSAAKPAGVTTVPGGVTTPLYGAFTFGPPAKQASITVLLAEPADGPPRLFVDGNADGDLTDDPVPVRSMLPYKDQEGITRTSYRWQGHVLMPSPDGGAPLLVSIGFDRSDKNDPGSEMSKETMGYYPDYIAEGTATLGGKSYPILLNDSNATGDCTVLKNLSLLIDVNHDGHFTGRSEEYEADKPFNIGGTTYEVGAMSSDSTEVTIVKSLKDVAEIPPAPNLNVGHQAPPFAVKATDGRTIDLSRDYKGRLILLDFWATWCVPCVAEQPGIAEAYHRFHGRGFDVLGISLDKRDELGAPGATKLADFTMKHNMTWPQVYDGEGFGARLAVLYGIWGIPALLLVDGDTGRIVADSETLRGDRLTRTLRHALALKSRQALLSARKTALVGKPLPAQPKR